MGLSRFDEFDEFRFTRDSSRQLHDHESQPSNIFEILDNVLPRCSSLDLSSDVSHKSILVCPGTTLDTFDTYNASQPTTCSVNSRKASETSTNAEYLRLWRPVTIALPKEAKCGLCS